MMEEELIGPYDISLDVTNKCNMRCLHCYNFSGENNVMDNEMSDDDLIRLAKEIRELKPMNVCICGGEPLLRIEIVKYIIKILKEDNINVNMVSNGTLLTEKIVNELEHCGLNAIQLSFDGIGEAYDNLRGVKDGYKILLNSFELLKNSEIMKVVSIAPTKWNKNQLEEIVKICKKYDIRFIRSQYLMPLGRGNKNFNKICLQGNEYYNFIKDINKLKEKYKDQGISFEWDDPSSSFQQVKDDITIPSMYIKADGNVLFSPYIPVTFGNVKETTLKSMIENDYLKVLKEKFFLELSNNIKSVNDMIKISEMLVESFQEQDIFIEEIRSK